MGIMTQTTIKEVLSRVATWPQKDQEELVEVAREIEARQIGVYVLDEEESAAIREGLAELDRGEWVNDEEMRSFWKRCGAL
jgi:predicted transcriptional regulator